MIEQLTAYRKEMEEELSHILSFWMQHTQDTAYGGFYGKVDNNNVPHIYAPKGVVLNARILWTFSEAYLVTRSEAYLQVADRAYHYLVNYFTDKVFGGVYWSLNYTGLPLESKKQVYAQAFVLYGLCAYYSCCNNPEVKKQAVALYEAIVQYSYDEQYGGYIEALTRDWQPLADLRLSEKDANEKKSMNTHLHVLEAFTTLYRIWPNEELRVRIVELIHIFLKHITSSQYHLLLFFNEAWESKSAIISYGHDIEAAWLLLEAAEAIGEEALIAEVKIWSVQVADAAVRGLDTDGGLWYEYDGVTKHWMHEKHWWPQAEAMVGFMNAWQLTGRQEYLDQSIDSWRFVQRYLLDKERGEWYWGVNAQYEVMEKEDKAGFWKCPYHNGRACLEIIRRVGVQLNNR